MVSKEKKEKVYRAKDLAEEVGVTPSAIRKFLRKQVIPDQQYTYYRFTEEEAKEIIKRYREEKQEESK